MGTPHDRSTPHGGDSDPEAETRAGAPRRAAPSRWSRPAENLTREPLLRHATSTEFDGGPRPSLAGRIVLLGKLGQGGMGVVYHGVHVRLGREVAVKLLPLAVQGQRGDMVQRFEREAQLAARLQSPHLVQVLDIDQDDATGCHFIVMEFVHGTSADRWGAQHPRGVPEVEALDVCIAATKGLVAAHVEGVVHRDIKPGNVLLPKGADGRLLLEQAKLADLGLARGGSGDLSLTGTHLAMGTPGFMAPEQAEDAKRAKKPADVFSMGATLYALLTGQAPFAGSSAAAALANTMLGRYPPIRDVRGDVSPPTATLIERCLRPEAAQRFPDASALLEALQHCRAVVSAGRAADAEAATRVVTFTSRAEQGAPVVTPPPSDRPERGHATSVASAAPRTPRPEPTRDETVRAASTRGPARTDPEAARATLVPSSPPGPAASSSSTASAQAAASGPAPRSRAPLVLAAAFVAGAIVVAALLLRGGPQDAGGGAPPHTPPTRTGTGNDAPSRGPEAPVTPPTTPKTLSPAPGQGTLSVRSAPSGAEVRVDGYRVGETPLAEHALALGSHDVELRLAGHEPHTARVQLGAGAASRDLGEIRLQAWGAVEIGALPSDVRVLVDGVPATGRVPQEDGVAEVEFARAGHVTQRRTVRVAPGAVVRVEPEPWTSLGLRYTWVADQEWLVTMRSTIDVTQGIAGDANAVRVVRDVSVRLQVAQVRADGSARMRFAWERIRGSVTGPAGSQEYDSETGEGDPTQIAYVGHWFDASIAADGEVRTVDGSGFRAPRSGDRTFSAGDTERLLTTELRALLPRLGEGVSAVGDVWQTQTLDLSGGLELESTTQWSLAERDARTVTLGMRGTSRSRGGEMDGLEGWRLQSDESSGRILLDAATCVPRSASVSGTTRFQHENLATFTMTFAGSHTVTWAPSRGR